jgi:serine/threonine protein kinase
LGLGYSLFSFETKPEITAYDAFTDIGLRGARANKNFPFLQQGAQINPATGGMNVLGTPGQTGNAERRPSITQTVTWVKANHTIQGGGEFRQDMLPNFGFGGANGNYSFTGNGVTWNPALTGVTGFSGNTNVGFTFANFLLGSVRVGTLGEPIVYRRSKQQWGVFLQDTWRARRNLTIDMGIRWDYGTYTSEDYGRLGALSLTEPNPSADGRNGGLIFEATCQCNFARNYPYAVGPAGTPAYMAPELFTGGRADERTDQFALAVSVYEGLYGVRPFAGDTAMALVENVVQGRMREPPERSRVPGWVHDIVVRALANKPDDRHESVRAMLASLAFIARVMFD